MKKKTNLFLDSYKPFSNAYQFVYFFTDFAINSPKKGVNKKNKENIFGFLEVLEFQFHFDSYFFKTSSRKKSSKNVFDFFLSFFVSLQAARSLILQESCFFCFGMDCSVDGFLLFSIQNQV